MKRHYLFVISFILIAVSTSCQTEFDQKIWLENNDFQNMENPRLKMVDDILNHHLKIGMKKQEVVKLLGEPSSDTIGVKLPKGVRLPDSLSVNYSINMSKEKRDEYRKFVNEWYGKNYKSVPMVMYILGWSLADPIFLEIEMDKDEKIIGFEVRQH